MGIWTVESGSGSHPVGGGHRGQEGCSDCWCGQATGSQGPALAWGQELPSVV